MATVSRDTRIFVGRTRELERLRALAQAATRAPAAAVLIAEPGLGKTRLLAELQPSIGLPQAVLRCYESARETPLAAAAGLIRMLATVPEAGPRLEALLLGETEATFGLERVRLHETAYRCVSGVVPLAVVVDDLQWADRETVALLQYLLAAAEAAKLPLFVLCAGRPSTATLAWAADLARLLGPDRFEELRLGPLEREEAAQLVAGVSPELADEEVERLWRLTQGSPFWLQALVADEESETSPSGLHPPPARESRPRRRSPVRAARGRGAAADGIRLRPAARLAGGAGAAGRRAARQSRAFRPGSRLAAGRARPGARGRPTGAPRPRAD
jgi:hypothetical protein